MHIARSLHARHLKVNGLIRASRPDCDESSFCVANGRFEIDTGIRTAVPDHDDARQRSIVDLTNQVRERFSHSGLEPGRANEFRPVGFRFGHGAFGLCIGPGRRRNLRNARIIRTKNGVRTVQFRVECVNADRVTFLQVLDEVRRREKSLNRLGPRPIFVTVT